MKQNFVDINQSLGVGVFEISSYSAKKNKDDSVTIDINPDGDGTNALPAAVKFSMAYSGVTSPRQIARFRN